MDTKSRKWKITASFIVFFFAVSLLINGGLSLLTLGLGGPSAWQGLGDAFASDYQNTAAFRRQISDYLEEFLTMACGGRLYSWEGYDDGEAIASSDDYGAPRTWVTEETRNSLSAGASESSTQYWDEEEWEAERLDTPARRRQAAQRAHEYYREDKNVLYSISYDSQLKYTNVEEGVLNGAAGEAPEGYNFLLYFDGKTVKITKDGKELDVYGDGYYREGSDWYVPGYKNFTLDKRGAKASVTIAAAESPMIYIKGNYGEDSSARQRNSLYWLEYNQKRERAGYISLALNLLIGAGLLALYFRLREEKRQADKALAALTGRVWFEAKLILLLCSLSFFFSGYGYGDYYGLESAWYYLRYEGGLGALSNYFSLLTANRLGLLSLFWLIYLFVLDLRQNPGGWQRHNLCGRLMSVLRSRQLELPVQQRLVNRCRPMVLAGLSLALIAGVSVVLLAGYSYDYPFLPVLLILALIALLIWYQYNFARCNMRIAKDIGALTDQIAAVKKGNLTQGMALPEDADLARPAQDLNEIQQGLAAALEEQTKSERMKVELIANVSHDVKTPLTSIISYVDLLNQEEDLPEHVKDYVKILNSKAERLKTMVQDVFEVSKAASGQLPVKQEILDMGKLILQTLADMEEAINASSVKVKTEIPEEPVMISADGQRLYRVFQNLLQNALKYSLEGSRVFVSLSRSGGRAEACVKNISKTEIDGNVDFTERFVRGDHSRSDGGSGLGLSIASSFTEACGGSFRVENIADLFVVTVEFEEIRPKKV